MSVTSNTETRAIRKTVSIPADLFEQSKAKADAESRDFSKHVQHLLRKDLKQSAPVIKTETMAPLETR